MSAKFRNVIILQILGSLSVAAFAQTPPVQNPWRELSDETREGLRPFMGPVDSTHPVTDDAGFQAWYHTYYQGDLADQNLKYPEYKYNHLTVPERVTSACVFLQVKRDFLDKLTTPLRVKASFVYGDAQGAVIAHVSHVKELRAELAKDKKFVPDFCAGPTDPKPYIYCGEGGPPKVWGLRGSVHGQTLHWYQTAQMVKDHQISVHIDYYNPGEEEQFSALSSDQRKIQANVKVVDQNVDAAFTHTFKDLVKWGDRNMVKEMSKQPNNCGLGARDVAYAKSETESDPPKSKWTKIMNQLNALKKYCQ